MCADTIQMLNIFIPFMTTCLQQFPLRAHDTSEMYLDSWCVLKDTDQICLIQQGDGVWYTFISFVGFAIGYTGGWIQVVIGSVTHGVLRCILLINMLNVTD